jgi:hypothetical protein
VQQKCPYSCLLSNHTMKKIFFAFVCFVATDSFSQTKIGFEGGFNSASFAQSGESFLNGYRSSSAAVGTFHVGIVSEIPLSKKIFLQPGLLYFGNGTHIIEQGSDSGYKASAHTTIQLYYLRFPVNVVYKIKLNNNLNFLAGAGLYIAKGLSGTIKGNGEGTSPFAGPFAYSFKDKVEFSNADSSSSQNNTIVKSFDAGFGILAGFGCKIFQLTAKYSRSFSEIYSDGGYNYRNAAFECTLAYLFSFKR